MSRLLSRLFIKRFVLSLSFGVIANVLVAQAKQITVAKNGSGDYTTVQAALNAVPKHNAEQVLIYIENGVYTEKLFLDSTQAFVTLRGEDKFSTILTYNDHTGKSDPFGKTINTMTSQSFLMQANDFAAINITFQNDAGFTAGQAVAVQVNGDRSAFYNCRFVGFQDVLFTNNPNSRQYYQDCYIEGTTDFIFGSSSVWFERCHIHSKKESHVTAASTPQEHKFGYVFHDCVLTGDSSLHTVSLGRPWRPYSSVTYLHCYMGQHILPEGWNNWRKESNEKTARYSEFESYGPGASPGKRYAWTRQLSDTEAKAVTRQAVLADWEPLSTPVNY